MKLEMVTITPKSAQKLLDTNLTSQRHISVSHVSKLAKMMKAGDFDSLNGQTIKTNTKGELIDGQHRLSAIIRSDMTFKMPILRDCPDTAFRTIDNAALSRTVENYYQIANKEQAKLAAQVAKWLYSYETHHGDVLYTPAITPGHLAEWALENHPDIPEVCAEVSKYCSAFQKCKLGTKPHMAFAYYLFRQKDPMAAHDVIRYLSLNEGSVTAVIAAGKQKLIRDIPTADKVVPGNVRIGQVIGTMLVSWNLMRQGSTRAGARKISTEMKKMFDPKDRQCRHVRLPEVV